MVTPVSLLAPHPVFAKIGPQIWVLHVSKAKIKKPDSQSSLQEGVCRGEALGVVGSELPRGRAGGQLPGPQLLWKGPSRDEERSRLSV